MNVSFVWSFAVEELGGAMLVYRMKTKRALDRATINIIRVRNFACHEITNTKKTIDRGCQNRLVQRRNPVIA